MYIRFIKPFLDKLAALLMLTLLWPVIALTYVLLAIVNGGEAWFIQSRPGRHGKVFQIIKFRTMTNARDSQGQLLPDDQRLTRIGYWVRKLSLDELPQLVNVLKGDMSLVGPRPLLVEYLPLYSADQKRRHAVRPGITGWAQVNGRNAITWEQKFAYDVWYVDHCGFLIDIKILFLTIQKVFSGKGVSSSTSATMEKFRGNG